MASFGTDDFIIESTKKSLVQASFPTISRLFNVTVAFDVVSNDGQGSKQWIVVSGNKESRRNAKSYILALCDPEHISRVSLASRDRHGIKDELLDDMQARTGAFVFRKGNATVEIKGTLEACTMAISQLEHAYPVDSITHEHRKNEEAAGAALSPGPSSTSTPLPKSVFDHDCRISPTEEVIHPLRGLGMHAEAQLFEDGAQSTPAAANRQLPYKHYPESFAAFGGGSSSLPFFGGPKMTDNLFNATVCGPPQIQNGLAMVGGVSPNSPSKAPKILKDGERDEKQGEGVGERASVDAEKHKQDMISLALGFGYAREHIDETVQFFDFSTMNIGTKEFLCALDEVKASRKSEGGGDSSSSPIKMTGKEQPGPKPAPGSGNKGGKGKQKAGKGNAVLQPGKDPNSKPPPGQAQSLGPQPKGQQKGPNPQGKSRVLSPQQLNKPPSPHAPGQTRGQSPGKSGKPLNLSPVPRAPGMQRFSTTSDDSVIFMGEDSMMGDKTIQNAEDSVIFVNDSDASVILTDAFPSEHRMSPPKAHSGPVGGNRGGLANMAVRGGHKRKELFSDDEEQTCVLRPYSGGGGAASSSEGASSSCLPTQGAVGGQASCSTAEEVGKGESSEDPSLRYVVVDGSNVAMSHGNDQVFSCKGIQLCVDYFVQRGHKVKVWVPKSKSYPNQKPGCPPITDQHILEELKMQGYLGFTPSRRLNNKFVQSHDDYFILDLAERENAVIVSNDNFREFNLQYGHIIEKRVLSYVFCDDHFMLPKDPLGRYGPRLDTFLSKTPQHPSKRAAKEGEVTQPHSAAPMLDMQAPVPRFGQNLPQFQLNPRSGRGQGHVRPSAAVPPRAQRGKSPQKPNRVVSPPKETTPPRHPDVTKDLMTALKAVFPEKEQEEMIQRVLDNHPGDTDLNKLTNYCIGALDL